MYEIKLATFYNGIFKPHHGGYMNTIENYKMSR